MGHVDTQPSGEVVLTGASGFIGSATLRALLDQCYGVRALQRPSSQAVLPPGVSVVPSELRDSDEIARGLEGAKFVIHLAGTGSPASPTGMFEEIVTTNVLGTQTVLQAAVSAGVTRVVIVSSSSVYGSIDASPLQETMPVMPVSVYGTSKLAAERIAAAYTATEGVETVCLRVFNMYGPGQWLPSQQHFLIPQLVRKMQQGLPIQIRGDGSQTRDYVHIDDVVRAIITAGLQPTPPQPVINIGSGRKVSVAAIVQAVADRLGVQPKVERALPRPGEIMHVVADTNLLQKSLGIRLDRKITDFIASMSDQELARYAEPIEP